MSEQPSVRFGAGADGAAFLLEALPYVQRLAGRTVVVKFGGNILNSGTEEESLELFGHDIALLHQVGIRPVVVHGGGPQISAQMKRLGKQAQFRDGLRVTDAETLDLVVSVTMDQINPQLVTAITAHGPVAVGVGGHDSGLIRATVRDPELGFVGDITAVSPASVEALVNDGLIPVIAPLGVDENGQVLNVNADTVAGAVAEALRAEKLIYLTDVDGVRRVHDDPATLIRQTDADELEAMIADGTIVGGMIPKAISCAHALRAGVRRAHILDGRVAHVILLEIFTDEGIGTMGK